MKDKNYYYYYYYYYYFASRGMNEKTKKLKDKREVVTYGPL